jgi:carbonic anhydrase
VSHLRATVQTIWEHVPVQRGVGNSVPLVHINTRDLLPTDHAYYTFLGSVTTPPCTEDVRWFVLKKPITASAKQIEIFTKEYPGNARPLQPLNGRVVLASR